MSKISFKLTSASISSVAYDHSVRDSSGHVLQFLYGEDGLDVVKCVDAPLTPALTLTHRTAVH